MLKFFRETGYIALGDHAVSARLINEALGDDYDVEAVEDREDYLDLRIRRRHIARIPFPIPQPRLRLSIDYSGGLLTYSVTWPDFWLLGVVGVMLLSFWAKSGEPFTGALVVFAVITMVVVLGNRATSKQLRGALHTMLGQRFDRRRD
jgi:hypothetical protein